MMRGAIRLVGLTVLLSSSPAAAEEYRLRVEFIEVRCRSDTPADRLLESMVVRPIEVVLSAGDSFRETAEINGQKLFVEGEVELESAGPYLSLTSARYGIERGDSLLTLEASGQIEGFQQRWDASETEPTADGIRTGVFRYILETAWPASLDRQASVKRRLLLDQQRADMVAKFIAGHFRHDFTREKAADALFKLVRRHHAEGEPDVARELTLALLARYAQTKAGAEARQWSEELAAAERKRRVSAPTVPSLP